MSVSLFDDIIKLRPEWAGTKLTKDGKDSGWNHEDGVIRIVMTGTASDRPGLQDHVYSKGQKKRLGKRFKDAKDPLKLVIVREGEAPRRLWLTAFDAPCCHTMVVDKPMAGHKERRYLTAVPMECQCWGGKRLSIDSPWASADRFCRSLIESPQVIEEMIQMAKDPPAPFRALADEWSVRD